LRTPRPPSPRHGRSAPPPRRPAPRPESDSLPSEVGLD
jgi:hypothetical protein